MQAITRPFIPTFVFHKGAVELQSNVTQSVGITFQLLNVNSAISNEQAGPPGAMALDTSTTTPGSVGDTSSAASQAGWKGVWVAGR